MCLYIYSLKVFIAFDWFIYLFIRRYSFRYWKLIGYSQAVHLKVLVSPGFEPRADQCPQRVLRAAYVKYFNKKRVLLFTACCNTNTNTTNKYRHTIACLCCCLKNHSIQYDWIKHKGPLDFYRLSFISTTWKMKSPIETILPSPGWE